MREELEGERKRDRDKKGEREEECMSDRDRKGEREEGRAIEEGRDR